MSQNLTEDEIKELSRQNNFKMVEFFALLLEIDKRTNPHLYNPKSHDRYDSAYDSKITTKEV